MRLNRISQRFGERLVPSVAELCLLVSGCRLSVVDRASTRRKVCWRCVQRPVGVAGGSAAKPQPCLASPFEGSCGQTAGPNVDLLLPAQGLSRSSGMLASSFVGQLGQAVDCAASDHPHPPATLAADASSSHAITLQRLAERSLTRLEVWSQVSLRSQRHR